MKPTIVVEEVQIEPRCATFVPEEVQPAVALRQEVQPPVLLRLVERLSGHSRLLRRHSAEVMEQTLRYRSAVSPVMLITCLQGHLRLRKTAIETNAVRVRATMDSRRLRL